MHMKSAVWEETVEWSRVVVGCVIYKDSKYLMVQEKQDQAYGLWNLPAGHVDKGESLVHAALREVEEETGYSVHLLGELGIYHHTAQSPVKHAYLAEITGGTLRAQKSEILQASWLTYKEIKVLNQNEKIRSQWVWLAINDHQKLLNKLTA